MLQEWVSTNAPSNYKYTLKPLTDFLSDWDWDHDAEYQYLKRDMTDWQIEFAKASVIYPNGAEAIRAITVEMMEPKTAHNRVQYLRNREGASRLEPLIAYLLRLYTAYEKSGKDATVHPPMFLENIITKWEGFLWQTNDPVLSMQLGEKIIKYRGWEPVKHAVDAVAEEDPYAIPEGFREELDAAAADG